MAAVAAAMPVELVVRPQEARIGEIVEVGIVRNTSDPEAAGMLVTGAEFVNPGAEWHVAGAWRQPVPGEGAPEGWLWFARVQSFETGELRVPGARAAVRWRDGSSGSIELAGPSISIVEGLDEGDTALRELQDIHPYTLDRRWIAAMAAGVLIVVLAVGYALRRALMAYRNRPAPPHPEPPPDIWAIREIERRRDLPECRKGRSKPIATEASDVIRRFLEKRYGFAALEMTSLECVRKLEDTYVPVGLAESVRRFLEECDMAKFTRMELGEERKTAIWDDAGAIVKLAGRAAEVRPVSRVTRVSQTGSSE